MKPDVNTISKPESVPVEIPTILPIAAKQQSDTRKLALAVLLTSVVLCTVFAILFALVIKSNRQLASIADLDDLDDIYMKEFEAWERAREEESEEDDDDDLPQRKNFQLQFTNEGHTNIEAVSVDEARKVVTIHNTGENGREIDTVLYDNSKDLVAVRVENTSSCFLGNKRIFPELDLDELEGAAEQYEVLDADQKLYLQITGVIPRGYFEATVSPEVFDLCSDVQSYWLEPSYPEKEDGRGKRNVKADTAGGVMAGIGNNGGLLIGIPNSDGTPGIMISFPVTARASIVVINLDG